MKGANEIVRCLTNVLNLLFGSILFYFIDMSLFFIRSISEFIVMAANTEPFEKLNLPRVVPFEAATQEDRRRCKNKILFS